MATTTRAPRRQTRAAAAADADTAVLYVRHGETATTGKLLPGRAPGLHLSDNGRQQAEAAAARIVELKRVDAVYASSLERARETAAPIAAGRKLRVTVERGLFECDFGEWTGAELKKLMKLPEWAHGAELSERFPVPRRGELPRDAGPDGVNRSSGWPSVISAASSSASRTPIPSRPPSPPRPRHPSRPVPAHRDLDVLHHGHHVRDGSAHRPHGQLDRGVAHAVGSVMTDDLGTVVLVSGFVGEPGHRTFYLQAQGPLATSTVKCEKGQVAALAEHIERLLADLPPIASAGLVPSELEPPLEEPRFVLGTIGLAYDAEADRVVVVLEELTESESEEEEPERERAPARDHP